MRCEAELLGTDRDRVGQDPGDALAAPGKTEGERRAMGCRGA